MTDATTEGSIFTIFGATGDLARRKLLPALYRSHANGKLDPRVRILGVSRTALDDEAFRGRAREALTAIGASGDDLDTFLGRLHYLSSPEGDAEDFARLQQKLGELRALNHIPENYVFYLSLPPRVFGRTIAGLGATGLNVSNEKGWTRIVVEKPFGIDLESARMLNAEIHEHFSEDQIYRTPTRSSNHRGTANGYRRCRSPSVRASVSAPERATTTSPVHCATCCRTTSRSSCRSWRWRCRRPSRRVRSATRS
jgi:glucose-6-phosphate 1-dehydrogenase